MGRETLRVPLLLFRSVSCTTNIHEIAESASISMEKVDYADHNLYRRYVNNRSNQKGSGVNTLIYLVQHLGFLLDLKKSVLQLCQEIEFLSLVVNSGNRTLSLLLQKVQKVQEECTKLYNSSWTPILEFTKRLGLLSLTIQAVVPACLQIRILQQLQIQSLKLKKSFQINLKLTALAKEELLWWMSNLRHSNGKLWIENHLDQMFIHADASKKGWGAVCKGVSTGGLWPKVEQLLHINVLELTMIALSREIWEVLIKKNLTISAEHLPSALNKEADWESQNSRIPRIGNCLL